jgi:hypothetical protein
MSGTPSKRLAAKRVTTKELQAQIDEMREQLGGVRRNKELGEFVGRLNGQVTKLQSELDLLKEREKNANKANYPMLQEQVAKAVVEFCNGPLHAVETDLVLLINAEKIRNDEQDTEIGTLKVTTNAHSYQINMVEQGQQSLHRRVSVLESGGFVRAVISFLIGALFGIIAANWYQSIPNSTAAGEFLVGIGVGAIVMALTRLVIDAVFRRRSNEKTVVVETTEPEDAHLDIMQPRDAELQNTVRS